MSQERPEAAVAGEVDHRPARTRFRIVGAPDHQPDPRLATGGDAHGTGFEGHVEGAVLESEIAGERRRLADRQNLGMCRRIVEIASAIAGPADDLTRTNDHGPDRNLIALRRRRRLGQSGRHEAAVLVIENPIGKHCSRDYTSGGPMQMSLFRTVTDIILLWLSSGGSMRIQQLRAAEFD